MSQAIVYIDGFDHYQSAKSTVKGWSANFTSMQTGRFAAQCARWATNSITAQSNVHGLPSSYSTIIAAFAFKIDKFTGASTLDIFDFRAGGTRTMRLILTTAGNLRVLNSSGTTIATGSTTNISTNTWYYVEVKLVINGASGSVQVRVNGATTDEIAQTTGNFGSTSIDSIALMVQAVGSGNTTSFDFDDLRVGDGTTGTLADFIGDTRVETVFPASDGTNQAWTPSAAGSHYNKVNESSSTFPDDDTTYVSDSNAGDRDTYGVGSLSSNAGQIQAFQVSIDARKDDAGAHTIAPVVRHSGTNYDGTAQAVSASYAFYYQIYQAMPNGDALTKARVEAAEYGVKLVS